MCQKVFFSICWIWSVIFLIGLDEFFIRSSKWDQYPKLIISSFFFRFFMIFLAFLCQTVWFLKWKGSKEAKMDQHLGMKTIFKSQFVCCFPWSSSSFVVAFSAIQTWEGQMWPLPKLLFLVQFFVGFFSLNFF